MVHDDGWLSESHFLFYLLFDIAWSIGGGTSSASLRAAFEVAILWRRLPSFH